MARLKIPNETERKKISFDKFLGCDFTSESANVSVNRSPEAPNWLRESTGKVKKRTGYQTIKIYPERINGVHFFADENDKKYRIIHAGTKLYLDALTEDIKDDTLLADDVANEFSKSSQLAGKLLIFDSNRCRVITKRTVTEDNKTPLTSALLTSLGKVPKVTIAREPTGGGEVFEAINLISTGRKDSFQSTGNKGEEGTEDFVPAATRFQLSANNLDEREIRVEVLTHDGNYVNLKENLDFYADRINGTITFVEPPGEPVRIGEDNVVVTYYKTVEGYADKINNCLVSTVYGASGTRNRIFAAAKNNLDYHCEINDPTYWGDIWYNQLAPDGGEIMGYSVAESSLVTLLKATTDNTNVILRAGAYDSDGNEIFVLNGTYQGKGAVSRYAIGNVKTEPIYLTKDGLYALTPSDVLGEKYSQERSYYLRRKLMELSLEDAYGVLWGDYYCVATNGYIFLLDSSQVSVEHNLPYSTRQYETFYWTGINARLLFEDGGNLYFGTAFGEIKMFKADEQDVKNYNDDGSAYSCYWKTPNVFGSDFSFKKKFKKVSALIGTYQKTQVSISAEYDGKIEKLLGNFSIPSMFSFINLQFSALSFITLNFPRAISETISIRPSGKQIQLIFENSNINEAIALYEANLEFLEL